MSSAQGPTSDIFVLAIVAAAFLLPVAIYLGGKLSGRFSDAAYKILGVFCIVMAAGFFAFVGWYFLTTGQLILPAKRGVPSTISAPTDPLGLRLMVGAINVFAGSLLAYVGVTLLRLKRASGSVVSGVQ